MQAPYLPPPRPMPGAMPGQLPPGTLHQEFLDRQWDVDHASKHIGIRIRSVHLDHAVLTLEVTQELVNGHGILHGGYAFTLADSAFAYAANSRGLPTVAAGADITFVASAVLGDTLVAEAQVQAIFGRNGIIDVRVSRQSDQALIAEYRGRARTMKTRREPAAEQPAMKQPASEQPAPEQPQIEQPASEQPAGSGPASD